ncbi:MAG: cobalamin-binding protein [Deltaproteobacteria bacterium]|nr:cobalamin-binding protein [Deltaproteobacteria bacterium]
MTLIVSLIASSTEIAAALGFEKQLVGRSHECDFPLSVKKLPVCTAPKFQTDGTSYEIDQRVKAILQEGLSVYRVDAKKLNELRPDVILTQSQCEVCAVSLKDVEEAVCELVSSHPQIVSLETNCLDDFWRDIRKVAAALKASDTAEELITSLKNRVAAIANKVEAVREPPLQKPTVACIEWIDPLMAAGNWMPELVEMAGGTNLFGQAGKHSPWMTWEELVKKDPDVIVVLPCGYDIQKTREEMPVLTQKKEWKKLKAVKNSHVFLTDGNQYFNRPGPRLVESLEILAEILHPSLFHFGHEGTGWQKLS